jgi:hypothetical protein
MLDLATAMAPHTYEVFNEERALRAKNREWRRRLREALRTQRKLAHDAKIVEVRAPEHLAGTYEQ